MNRFPGAIDATPDPTLVVDGDGVVHAGTPSVEAVFGLDPAELAGRSIDEVFEDPTELDWGSPPSMASFEDGEKGDGGEGDGEKGDGESDDEDDDEDDKNDPWGGSGSNRRAR